MMRNHTHRRREALRDALGTSSLPCCVLKAPGYGRIRYWAGFENFGPHRLPIAVFSGGTRVAMYAILENDGTWRSVCSTAAATAPRN